MARAGRRGFPAHFDRDAWEEDLARSTPAGRQAADVARRDYERGGVPFEHARRVQEHGGNGTVLPNCAKIPYRDFAGGQPAEAVMELEQPFALR